MTSTWKKMLDLLMLTCSKISLPEFSISKPLKLLQPGSSAPSQQFGDKRESPGLCCCCSHWNEPGLLQFSVFSPIPGAHPHPFGFHPKMLQSREVSGWGGMLGFGLERRNSVLPFSSDNRKFLCCTSRSPGPSKEPTPATENAAEVGQGYHSTKAVTSTNPLNFALPEFSKSSYNSKSTSIK